MYLSGYADFKANVLYSEECFNEKTMYLLVKIRISLTYEIRTIIKNAYVDLDFSGTAMYENGSQADA